MSSFQLGYTYNFNTRAPALLGAVYKNAKVIGIVDYSTAMKYINVDSMQRTIYPVLPENTPSDPKFYTFIIFSMENGSTNVLALQWIEETTVVPVNSVTLVVTLNNVDTSDTTRLRDTLSLMGYNSFTINVQ